MMQGHIMNQQNEVLAEVVEKAGLDEERAEKYLDATFGPEQ
jgi:hypothetical protein